MPPKRPIKRRPTPSKPTKQPAPRLCSSILDIIDNFLSSKRVHVTQRRALWDILTSLRGPDDRCINGKHQFTLPIRRAALPKTSTSGLRHDLPSIFSLSRNSDRAREEYPSGHFKDHGRNAIHAITIHLGRTLPQP